MTETGRVEEHLEGRTLDRRFYIRRRLGAGGFGAVYEAEQRIFGLPLRPVALKLLHADKVTKANAADVLNDAVRLIQLQHEPGHAQVARYLVDVFDAGFLDDLPGQAYVLMELVEGYRPAGGGHLRTLADLIVAFRPVPVDLAVRWMSQILRPLAWMHTLKPPVLHCDLKPENVLACGKDTLKLADFGLAQLVYGHLGVGGVGGTLPYQAPETLAGLQPTPESDVYALGLLFHEILTGRNPLQGAGRGARAGRDDEMRQLQLEAREAGLPSLLDADHPELADEPLLANLVERCLGFHASRRYANAAVLERALRSYVDARADAASVPSASRPPSLGLLLEEVRTVINHGALERARRRCEDAVEAFADRGLPYACLAWVELAAGRWQQALLRCAEGLRVEPEEPELFDVMAEARERAGQLEMAEPLRQRARILRFGGGR